MRKPIIRTKSVQAPIGGWNTRDALDDMPVEDATDLRNLIPQPGKVAVRKGYAQASTGATGSVESLFDYHSGATQKIIGAAGEAIYDFTDTAAVELDTGFSNARWHGVSFNGYLHLVNGEDAPQNYEGTTLAASGWSGSGLTPADLDGVVVFKERLIYWDSSTQDFWYAAVEVITGTLTKFPLSRVGQFGGNLTAVAVLNIDAGDGVDDVIVFIMSSGEAIAYQGTDPGDATAWALIGVFNIGRPIHRRAMVQVGGDVVVTTYDDYISLSSVLQKGYTGGGSKLSGAIQEEAALTGTSFGWQSILHSAGGLLIMNVPLSNGTYEQHVTNVQTKASCKFTGIKSHCWCVSGSDLYFGGDSGTVYKYTGNTDAGSAISAFAQQAWSDLGTSQRKNVKLIRPLIKASGTPVYEIGLGFEFSNIVTTTPTDTPASLGVKWDTEKWDTVKWGWTGRTFTEWKVSSGTGYTVAQKLLIQTKGELSWLRTDYRFEVGQNI